MCVCVCVGCCGCGCACINVYVRVCRPGSNVRVMACSDSMCVNQVVTC